jgi:mRNA-degrading endonuclease RelE of RelBE toxin-antitoxin system
MSFSIELTAGFERQFKKLIKKYPSLKEEIIALRKDLLLNPQTGTPIGKDCYKIRIAIHSKGKGKSGGGRIITHVYVSAERVFLLTIYDKSEKENIGPKELQELLTDLY